MLLRDKFWLWGHPEGCYNNSYGNTNASRMTPMEACLYLGIKNTFMVPDGEHKNVTVNRRQYNKSFTTLKQVGWECREASVNPEAVPPFIEDARDFSNIGCLVFDEPTYSFESNYEKIYQTIQKIANQQAWSDEDITVQKTENLKQGTENRIVIHSIRVYER